MMNVKINQPAKLKEINIFNSMQKKVKNEKKAIPKEEVLIEIEENQVVVEKKIKLAPVFQRKKKPVIDPEVQKARFEFLHSGLPSSVKKNIEVQKAFAAEYDETPFFPTISHVQQKDESDCWKARNIIVTKLRNDTEDYSFNLSDSIKFHFSVERDKSVALVNEEPLTVNVDDCLNHLQIKYSNVDVKSIINSVREKRDKYQENIKQIESVVKKSNVKKKKKANNSVEIIIDDENDNNLEIYNCIWTEKYKPKSSEILSNDQTVKRFRNWLESWKAFDEEVKRLAKMGIKVKSKKSSGNSSDDFVTSDEEDSNVRSPGNICILSGPVSSGKTSLVSSLANELEFNVIEVNASSKRTGKKLLAELQEATKSHKVHHDVNQMTLNYLMNNNKNKKKPKSKATRGKKAKKKDVEEMKFPDPPNNCKISLILIEDADIVFEDHDEGFVPALASLVQSSKRPVIFLTSDPICSHLHRFRTQQCLTLEMSRPSPSSLCALLDTISTFEGAVIKKEDLQSLVEQNRNDIRKCILELQFWIQNGQRFVESTGPLQMGSLWWGCNQFLFNKEIKHQTKVKSVKRKRINNFFDSSEDEDDGAIKKPKLEDTPGKSVSINNVDEMSTKRDKSLDIFLDVFENLSLIDTMHSSDDYEPIPAREFRLKDSLSLTESMEAVDWTQAQLANDITDVLVQVTQRVFCRKMQEHSLQEKLFKPSHPSLEEIRWRMQQEEARSDLLHLVPATYGGLCTGLNLDYLPIIRNICRTEKDRFCTNTKRKNRFFHYLKTLGADPLDDNLDVNCEILET